MFETIQVTTTVNEILQRYPESLKVFYLFNVDVCCGAGKTLEEAAREKGLVAEDLIEALQESLAVRSMPFAS